MNSAIFFTQSVTEALGYRRVIACVDHSENAANVILHASAIAEALGVPATLLQVLEAKEAQAVRPDPIEWDLRRREARSWLRDLAEHPESTAEVPEIELADGEAADEIIRLTNEHQDSLLVLGTHGEHVVGRNLIGGTVHKVLDRATNSVLLVPATASIAAPAYRRIIVPLDGSPWAESAIPLAVRVAQSTGAELLLLHVVPAPELTEPSPLEAEDMELRCRIIERNERTAREYLDRLRKQLSAQGLHVEVVIKRGDNVCAALAQTAAAKAADLVIMSALGHSNRQYSDVRYGHVASYMMAHARMPLLIARPHAKLQDPGDAIVTNHQLIRMPAVGSA